MSFIRSEFPKAIVLVLLGLIINLFVSAHRVIAETSSFTVSTASWERERGRKNKKKLINSENWSQNFRKREGVLTVFENRVLSTNEAVGVIEFMPSDKSHDKCHTSGASSYYGYNLKFDR